MEEEVKVRNGLVQEDAKKIVKLIKDSGMKVQAFPINDDLVRVTGKKIDDLQSVIQLCKTSNLGIPLQYVNMRDWFAVILFISAGIRYFLVDNRVHNRCKSRWPKIWKKGIAESIFDIQLHGILANKRKCRRKWKPLKR